MKVKDWILDLGHTVGHVSLYEKMVVVYWLMKNLVDREDWDRQNVDKEGNAQDSWKLYISGVVQRVEAKVDFLISCMGFQYPPSPSPGVSKPGFSSTSQGGGQDLTYILL